MVRPRVQEARAAGTVSANRHSADRPVEGRAVAEAAETKKRILRGRAQMVHVPVPQLPASRLAPEDGGRAREARAGRVAASEAIGTSLQRHDVRQVAAHLDAQVLYLQPGRPEGELCRYPIVMLGQG